MWLTLSEGVFYFGSGGITVCKEIDLRDKPNSFIFRTELFSGAHRIGMVQETVNEIQALIGEGKK
jgi:hypothetical protein